MELLSFNEEKELSNEELLEYYQRLRKYLLLCPYERLTDKGIAIKEKLNITIKQILKKIIKYPITVDGYENIPVRPVIYASSHQDFNDITNSIYAYPEHVLTLNASNISSFLKILLNLNGVIYVDRDNKESRKSSKLELSKALLKGKSINLYPEGTWNCTPSKLHLPFYIGMIDIAKITGAPIIPVVQEYIYDESVLDGKSHIKEVYISFGRPIYVSIFDDRLEKLNEFDEVFSTLRWQLIEKKGLFKRENLNDELYINYIHARMNDWKIPKNDINEERCQVYGADSDLYLFQHINDVIFNDDGLLLPPPEVSRLDYLRSVREKIEWDKFLDMWLHILKENDCELEDKSISFLYENSFPIKKVKTKIL